MFAGPNGSGKSTLKQILPVGLLGIYLNADELEVDLRGNRRLNFADYGVRTADDDVLHYLKSAPIVSAVYSAAEIDHLKFNDGQLDCADVSVNSYLASGILGTNFEMSGSLNFAGKSSLETGYQVIFRPKNKSLPRTIKLPALFHTSAL